MQVYNTSSRDSASWGSRGGTEATY